MIILKISNFIKALWFHIGLGLPKCNNEQIIRRYNICIQCDRFDTEKSQCKECGCFLNTKKILFNKLAWADQECPIGKWPKEI